MMNATKVLDIGLSYQQLLESFLHNNISLNIIDKQCQW
jgi:hypothetical protein